MSEKEKMPAAYANLKKEHEDNPADMVGGVVWTKNADAELSEEEFYTRMDDFESMAGASGHGKNHVATILTLPDHTTLMAEGFRDYDGEQSVAFVVTLKVKDYAGNEGYLRIPMFSGSLEAFIQTAMTIWMKDQMATTFVEMGIITTLDEAARQYDLDPEFLRTIVGDYFESADIDHDDDDDDDEDVCDVPF